MRAGVVESEGERVLFSDADLAAPIEELEKLESALLRGADVAIGSRGLRQSEIRVRQNPMREYMGRTFNLIVRALAVSGIRDTQCGFKLFTGEAARDLFSRLTVEGFAFDVELLVLARGRYRVEEVPIAWRHVEESKVSPRLGCGPNAARCAGYRRAAVARQAAEEVAAEKPRPIRGRKTTWSSNSTVPASIAGHGIAAQAQCLASESGRDRHG